MCNVFACYTNEFVLMSEIDIQEEYEEKEADDECCPIDPQGLG